MKLRVLSLSFVMVAMLMVISIFPVINHFTPLPEQDSEDSGITPDLMDEIPQIPPNDILNLTNDYQLIWEPNNIRGSSHAVATSPDKNLVVVAGGYLSDKEIHLYRWYGPGKEYVHVWSSGDGIFQDDVMDVEFSDINMDGRLEVVAGCADGRVYVFEALGLEYGPMYLDNADNKYELVWHSGDIIPRRVWSIKVADLNKDGITEIIAGAWDNRVYVFELAWASQWPECPSHDLHFNLVWTSGDIITGRVSEVDAGDTDYDGRMEIIAGSYDCKVYIFEAIPCAYHEYVHVWDSGNTIYDPINSIVVASDMDSDPYGEIAVAVYGQGVFVFHYEYPPGDYSVMKLNRPIQKWEMGLTYPGGPGEWTGYEADIYIDKKIWGGKPEGITEPSGIPYPWSSAYLGGESALGGPRDDLATTFSAPEQYYALASWQYVYGNDTGEFQTPWDIAFDSGGNAYIVDPMNHKIHKMDPNGEQILEWGELGSEPGELRLPYAVTVDMDDNVYVADAQNHRIQVFTPDGDLIHLWGENGNGTGQFLLPVGIDADEEGRVFVTDFGNSRVQIFEHISGEYIGEWGTNGSLPGQFFGPVDIEIDDDGFIFVADLGNDRIQAFDFDGNYLHEWGSTGLGPGEFDGPAGIAIDREGHVYVSDSDNDRIQKFTRGGVFITEFGFYGGGLDGFRYPRGAAIGPDNALYICDLENTRVKKYAMQNYTLEWQLGIYGNETSQFMGPWDIETDGSGNVYVSDYDNKRIQKFSSSGDFILNWTFLDEGNNPTNPFCLEVSDDLGVYVGDRANGRIVAFDFDGNFLHAIGEPGSADGQLSMPRDMVIDAEGNLYVADAGNYRIQVFDPAGNFLHKFGEYGAGAGDFQFPYGISIGPDGLLYVTDTDVNSIAPWDARVQVFELDGTYVDEWEIELVSPTSDLYTLDIDHDGSLYISEGWANKVHKFRSDGTKLGMLSDHVGNWNESFDFVFPLGIEIDNEGYLYLTNYFGGDIAKTQPNYVSSNVSYVVVDFGQFEEVSGDATTEPDLNIIFPNVEPDVEKVEIRLSQNLKQFVTVQTDDKSTFMQLQLFPPDGWWLLQVDIDPALRAMDWDNFRYMQIRVKGTTYDIDAAFGTVAHPVDSAYVVRTGYVNTTAAGDNIKEILVGTAEGDILAFSAEDGDIIWDSQNDQPRFDLPSGIRDIVQLDGRGRMPTFEFGETWVTPASFSGITVNNFHGYALGNIDGSSALDMVVTANVSGSSSWMLYLRNTGTNANPIWTYIPDFFYNNVPNMTLGNSIGKYASPSLVDLDEDGDLDIFIIEGASDIDTTDHLFDLWFFERTSPTNWYVRDAETYLNMGNVQTLVDTAVVLPKITFWDVNYDGHLDMIVGNKSLYFFERSSTGAFTWFRDDTYFESLNDTLKGTDLADKVAFSDWDKDGDLDITVGLASSNISNWIADPESCRFWYYENTGTPANPVWVRHRSIYEPDFRGTALNPERGHTEVTLKDMDGNLVEDLIGMQMDEIRVFMGVLKHDSYLVATYPYIHMVEVDKRPISQGFYGYEAFDSWSNAVHFQDWTYAIDFADTDEDGKNEVIVGSFDSNIYTFEQVENNTYRRAWRSPDLQHNYTHILNKYTIWEDVKDLVVGDLDDDGKQEIIAVSGWRIVIFENIENNIYDMVWHSDNLIPQEMGVSLGDARDECLLTELAIDSDLDSDGHSEIAVASHEWLFIFEHVVNDTYDLVWVHEHPYILFDAADPEIYDLLTADSDTDGYREVIVIGNDEIRNQWGELEGAYGWIRVWENAVNASNAENPHKNDVYYESFLEVRQSKTFSVAVADYDKSGKAELYIGEDIGVEIWLNTGNNTYALDKVLLTENAVSNVIKGNTDRDAFKEIIVSQEKQISVFEQTNVSVLTFYNVWNSTKYSTKVTDLCIGDSNHNNISEILVTAAGGYVYSHEFLFNTTEVDNETAELAGVHQVSRDSEVPNSIPYCSVIAMPSLLAQSSGCTIANSRYQRRYEA